MAAVAAVVEPLPLSWRSGEAPSSGGDLQVLFSSRRCECELDRIGDGGSSLAHVAAGFRVASA